jgi:hypothetical protein
MAGGSLSGDTKGAEVEVDYRQIAVVASRFA